MDYLDTLRRNGWLADPSDRVRIVVIHAEGCPANVGRTCRCNPRLVLAADYPPHEARNLDSYLPMLDAASGE